MVQTEPPGVRPEVSFSGEYAVEYLVRLILSFSSPKDTLSAYLRCPLSGVSFRRNVGQIAKGNFRKSYQKVSVSPSEIMKRAQRVLQWLDGKELDGKNPYEVLGLSYSATSAQILHRYRTLCKRVHPDRHPRARQDYWLARQQEVNEAYQILSDRESRAQYLARVEERKNLLRRLWQIERAHRR